MTGTERPIPCGCFADDWIAFINRSRVELGLGPDEKYAGDFGDVDVALMARLSTDILNTEQTMSDLSTVEGMKYGGNRCPGGVASAAIFGLAYCIHPYTDRECRADAREFAESALVAMMGSIIRGDPGDCTQYPAWLFTMEDALLNVMGRSDFSGPPRGWESRVLERSAARLRARGLPADAPVEPVDVWPALRPPVPPCGLAGVNADTCCEGADLAELEAGLGAWLEHPHAMVGLPPNYRDLMTAVRYVDYPLWPSVLPWLLECKPGVTALALVASLAPAAGVLPQTVEQLVTSLLLEFPLQALASSRFPVFGVIARVLETEETPSAAAHGAPAAGTPGQPPPRACHSDLAVHLHGVLVGTAALDMSLVSDLAGVASVESAFAADEENICAQQLMVAVAALGGWPLEAFGSRLVGNKERAQAWSSRTPWPVWSALHSRWKSRPPLSPGCSAAPFSLSPFTVTSVRSAGFSSVASQLMRLDFNGWSLPGSALEAPADALAQDDGWTGSFDEVLRRRLDERRGLDPAQEPRVAFLETRFTALFDGAVNMDHRSPEEQESNMIVPHQAFEDLWARFVASDKDSEDFLLPWNRSTRLIYRFDKGLIAFIRAWKADFICWPTQPTAEAVDQLAIYDLVLMFDVWPIGRPQALPPVPGQVRLWMPWEPWALQGDISLPADFCPVVVDAFAVARAPSVLLWHHLSVADWQRAFPPPPLSSYQDLPEVLLFYYDPSSSAAMEAFLRNQGFKVSHAAAGTPWGEYWRTLQRAWVAVMPMRTKKTQFSAGQVMADGAMAACVPTFSPRTKLLARLLMPSFLSYRSHEELAAKLLLLQGHRHWRRLLSEEACRRLRYVDDQYVEAASQFLHRAASQSAGDERCVRRPRR